MSTWVIIVVLAAGSVALKVTGPLLAGGRTPPPWADRVVALLAPALIASLVVVATITDGQTVRVDARAVGVVAGALALWWRAPLVLALLIAATATAALRAAA